MSQKIHLLTTCWNQEEILPHFFKHYDSFVDHYYFFDDGSTDNTLQILSKHPKVEIRKLPRLNINSFITATQDLQNNFWKENGKNVDWLIITDTDEFLYTQNIISYLKESTDKGITAIPTRGYQMISKAFPSEEENLLLKVTSGCPWYPMNKLSIFNPNEILETNFTVGRHDAKLQGNVVFPDKTVLLNLHFKYLDFEKTFKRHLELQKRLGKYDKKRGWGYQYSWTKKQFKKDWDYIERNAHHNILDPNYVYDLPQSFLEEQNKHILGLDKMRIYRKVRSVLKKILS